MQVTEQDYFEGCKHGARTTLEYRVMRLVDGDNRYFLLVFSDPESNKPEYYLELTAHEAFDLLATYHYALNEHGVTESFFETMDFVIDEIIFETEEQEEDENEI